MEQVKKVFISYSHDSDEHKNKVLLLSNQLREEGIDSVIDQYDENPAQGWAQWMIEMIKESDYIIAVCSDNYCTRFEGNEQEGRGKGGKWEGKYILQFLYEAEKNERILPVVFCEEDIKYIPLALRPYTYYNLQNAYEKLYRFVTGQPRVIKPPLGKIKSFPLESMVMQ
ncbi:toll/interleukin-1 receptor domain-containing protein [Paenibacillus rhizoplanae]|uniref:toll/interleukin-1 receptor domain-containing protein n=1 Tax=Paenibacillus rhizoplanae TaxID=1917181 RepID=UPI00361C7A42